MRTLFALILIALLFGVGAIALIETDPGYVLLSYGKYTVESSLWVGLLLLLAVAAAIFFLIRLIYRLISGQRSLFNWLGDRQTKAARRNTTRGLISYGEGNWAAARRQLVRGAHKNEAPLINHLLSARASAYLDEPGKMREFLDAAVEEVPDAAAIVDITRAELHVKAGHYDQAQAALSGLRSEMSKYPHALEQMRAACEAREDWDGLYQLLPQLHKHKLLQADEYDALERRVNQHRLQNACDAEEATTETLRATWQSVPANLKQDPELLGTYVRQLVQLGDHDTAEKLILKGLKQSWEPSLVREFGLLEGGQLSRRLAQAERWLNDHPDDPELLLCLGRLCARDRLWGKSRDYLESSYKAQRSTETCAELGRLLTALGEPKVAAAYYRDGIMLCEDQLPSLPMPEVVSGQLMAP